MVIVNYKFYLMGLNVGFKINHYIGRTVQQLNMPMELKAGIEMVGLIEKMGLLMKVKMG
jgi:hypothetical protein